MSASCSPKPCGALCAMAFAVLAGCGVTDAGDVGDIEGSVQQAATGFDWGGDCSKGAGQFAAFITRNATTTIGPIPAGKRNVRISLNSSEDVDVQLIDSSTGYEIIAWPSGDLNGAAEACSTYRGVEYCYSGYNGDQTPGGRGNEWIEVRGDSNRQLEMRAFGFAAGTASVSYSWQAVPTCREKGSGQFDQFVPSGDIIDVGDIPPGKVNVRIDLRSANDVDVQLYDGQTALVQWPRGLLNGPSQQSLAYQGMTIVYSGYNGDGTGLGHEYIEVQGAVTRTLTMKAFGYAAGDGNVSYSWGSGAGEACASRGPEACSTGLVCKDGNDGNIAVGIPGTCHTANWCESELSAAADCASQIHIAVPGAWGCDQFECTWRLGISEPI